MLLQKHPGLRVHRGIIRPACNWKYAGKEMHFGNGDEVALIPLVSGG
jgi:molybdopterin converting factor small subunit